MLLNLLTLPASLYLLIASICIANRMTRRTKHAKRVMVAAIGGIAFWSLTRTARLEWVCTPTNIGLAALVLGVAIVLAFFPRVRV